MKVSDDVCPACNPGILESAYVVKTGYENRKNKLFKAVPDLAAREIARGPATKYKVVLPKDKDKIIEALRHRSRKNQNFLIGETLADLKRENKEHGIK